MTREEALKLWLPVISMGIDNMPELKEAFDMAFKALEQEPKTGWIPVSERLPEESLNSIIGWDTYRERCVFVQYIDGYFQIMGSAESFDIVAWRPLPEPYKKGVMKNEQTTEKSLGIN